MFVSRVIQGRLLSSDDVELIQRLIADHPHWSRNRLSIAVSEQFNWRTATGQLKDMSARLLLAKLAESGLIELPPRQRRGGRQRLRVLSEPDLFWLASGSVQPIESPLKALRPLEVVLSKRVPKRPMISSAISTTIIIWVLAVPQAKTCATSFATVPDATWPVYSLPGRPGKSKPGTSSSAGAQSSDKGSWGS